MLVNNYRPISLLCVLSKIFEICVFNQCYPIVLPQFYHFQHGFLKGRSTLIQLLQVYDDILQSLSNGQEGSILGPLLFIVYINDMPDYIQYNSTMALFADYSKFYKTIQDSKDSQYLQSDLTKLNLWCNDWDMKFNRSKCKVLNISKKIVRVERSYEINSTSLETVTHISDLGINVSNNLTWNRHIEEVTLKGNKKLGLIRRLCKDIVDTHTRKIIYCSIVRPQLEYGRVGMVTIYNPPSSL